MTNWPTKCSSRWSEIIGLWNVDMHLYQEKKFVCVCVFVCYHHHQQQQHHHHKQPNEPRRQQLFALTQTNWAVSWSCRHLISDKLRAIALLKPLFVFVFCVCVCVDIGRCRCRAISRYVGCLDDLLSIYIYLCLYIYSYSSSAWNVISNVQLLLLSFLVPLHKLLICYINNISMLLFVSRCMSESNDGRVGLIHWEITFRPLIQIIF